MSQPTQKWLMDSGTTHYLTVDLGNLAIHSEYQGPREVTLDDVVPSTSTSFDSTTLTVQLPMPTIIAASPYSNMPTNGCQDDPMQLASANAPNPARSLEESLPTDLGNLSYFWGIEATWTTRGLHLCQQNDADWGGSLDDRKSTTGFAIYLRSHLISWASRKQKVVSHLSIKSEYRALACATSELTWLEIVLKEIGCIASPVPILSSVPQTSLDDKDKKHFGRILMRWFECEKMPEVSIDGFSIREYTAKMRSVDVVKCCPLDNDDVKAKLPPIEVKKFRWWRDVLVSDKDSDDDDVVVSVAKIGTAERKMIKSVKGKTRVQKKRSIADIFAVTPQVERIDDEEENDNIVVANEGKTVLSYQNVNAIGNGKSKRRSTVKTKREKTIVSKLKKVKKTIVKDKKFKQKKKVNSGCSGLLIRKKEKPDKLKVPNSSPKPSCSQHRKKCEKDMRDASPTYWRKPQRKHMVSEKKAKGPTDSKFSLDHQKMVNPVCSNLKKRTRRFPVEKSTGGILCGSSDANFCSNQQGDKHVTSDNAAERGEVLPLVEEKVIDKYISSTTESEVTVQPGSPKILSTVHTAADASELLRDNNSSTKDHSFEGGEVLSQVPEENDNLQLLRRSYGLASQGSGSLYLCNPGSLHVPQQMYEHQRNDQIVGSPINACGANEGSHDQLRCSLPEVAGVCSMHSVKAYPQHSSAQENLNRRKPILLPEDIMGNCSGHCMQYQPLPQISRQELMCKTCSFPEWKQRESMYREKGIEKDYVRLPLNSQGELIDLNSNRKRKLTQLPSSMGIAGSSRGLAVNNASPSNMEILFDARGRDKRAPSTDQLKRSSADDSMEWSPTFPVPSRLGIYEYDAGRTNVEIDPLKKNEESITPFELDCPVSNLSDHRIKQNYQAKLLETTRSKQYGNSDDVSLPVTPSKMRLMGQEFTVGGRDFHVPQDKRIWTDKQFIADNFSAQSYRCNSVVANHDQQNLTVHPVLGTLKGVVACSPSIQINQPILRPRVCPPQFSCQIDPVQQNCLGATKQSPFTGGCKSFNSYAPVPTLMHHYSSQNGVSSFVDLNSSSCAMNFPFLRPDSGRLQPSWSPFSSESTPWFSVTKEKKSQMDLHELYSTSDRKHHYYSIAGDNRQFDPSVYLAPERFCSFTQRSPPVLVNPVPAPSSATYSPMPLQIGPRVNAGPKKRHGDVKNIISTPCLRDPGDSRKGKKRPLSTLDDCTNLAKIPNLGFQQDPYVVLAPLKSHSNFEGQFSWRKAFEAGSVKGVANSIESGRVGASDARLGSFNNEDTLKLGPIKLTAGAKHVLKPCQNNAEKNFQPTHSTVQFGASSAGNSGN
ncbi:hypothetical protein T459_33787 [Capsicum annuum]|uniref:Uncharacterized protein n=1 Tax=Capsicum annuum TaxID=4072 RepID=A0A2G2XYF2_CAPAN|nr:hypothetical protein T459_33787 [Capsicum annuum]